MDPLLAELQRQGLKGANPAPTRKAHPAKAAPAYSAPRGGSGRSSWPSWAWTRVQGTFLTQAQYARGLKARRAKLDELQRTGRLAGLGYLETEKVCDAAERAAWGER